MQLTERFFSFTRERLERVWQEAGLTPPNHDLFENLHAAYSEPHRAYHTVQHIEECLQHLDVYGQAAPELELALWFHDAIYDPQRHDNEERSAEWAAREVSDVSVASTVTRLILVTKHHVAQADDERLLTDIDLSILGASPKRFAEYERQIRIEYAWVPEDIYRRERAKVLQRFSEREHIYSTEFFRGRLEAQARANLTRATVI
jgi:predicted metal-dependent HD superfamily phosphohydrolase